MSDITNSQMLGETPSLAERYDAIAKKYEAIGATYNKTTGSYETAAKLYDEAATRWRYAQAMMIAISLIGTVRYLNKRR